MPVCRAFAKQSFHKAMSRRRPSYATTCRCRLAIGTSYGRPLPPRIKTDYSWPGTHRTVRLASKGVSRFSSKPDKRSKKCPPVIVFSYHVPASEVLAHRRLFRHYHPLEILMQWEIHWRSFAGDCRIACMGGRERRERKRNRFTADAGCATGVGGDAIHNSGAHPVPGRLRLCPRPVTRP